MFGRRLVCLVSSRLFFFLALLASLYGAEYYGTIRREGTNYWVRWSNVPPAFALQHTTDLSNWSTVYVLSRASNYSAVQVFEHSMGTSTNALFYRLRQIKPIESWQWWP